MYTVIGSPQTRAIRVIWCLEELGLEYEIKSVAPSSEEAKKYNPSGKVPALVVGDDFTIPDIVLGQCYGWAKFCGFDIPKGTVEDYLKRATRRPAFIKAMKIRKT